VFSTHTHTQSVLCEYGPSSHQSACEHTCRHPCRGEGGKDCSDGHALCVCWNRECFRSFHRHSCSAWFVTWPGHLGTPHLVDLGDASFSTCPQGILEIGVHVSTLVGPPNNLSPDSARARGRLGCKLANHRLSTMLTSKVGGSCHM
jgi:hypothetical protein